VDFCQILDSSVRNERKQGITLRTCNWKKPRGVVLNFSMQGKKVWTPFPHHYTLKTSHS